MTHDDKVKHIYKELKEKYPDIDHKMMYHFMKKMPAEAYIAFTCTVYAVGLGAYGV
jgi:uncharacterized protein with HEPN domain